MRVSIRRYMLILVAVVAVATVAHAYTTGEWLCSSGACTIGASTATSTQLIGGGESISIGATTDEFLFTTAGTGTVLIKGADATGNSHLAIDTSAGGTIVIGSADVASLTVTTVAGSMDVGSTTANTLTVTATGANTAIFQGADATGGSDTQLDTEGIGTVTIGSADVTEVLFVTDGGTTVFDGVIKAPKPIVALAATDNLTANSVHIISAAGDYTLPACGSATMDWVTVVQANASEVVKILPDTGSTIFVPGVTTTLDANDELDSAGAADGAGDFVSLICSATNKWYGTSLGGAWSDGGSS